MDDGQLPTGCRSASRVPWWRRRGIALARAWRRTGGAELVHERRFTTAGLTAAGRRLVLTAGVVCVGLAVVLVFSAVIGHDSPSVVKPLAVMTHAFSAPVVLALLAGLLMTQVILVHLVELATGRRRLLLALLAAFTGVMPLVMAVRLVGLAALIYDHTPPLVGAVGAALLVAGVVAAVTGIALATRPDRRPSVALAVAPLLTLAVYWVAIRLSAATFSGSVDHRFPERLSVGIPLAAGLVMWGISVAGAGLAITLWQVVEATRAVSDGATAGAVVYARSVRSIQWRWGAWSLVAVLLGVKLTWLVTGLAGWLPGWLGGSLEAWDSVLSDGWLSWLIAAAVAVAMVEWLRRGCPGPRDHGNLVGVTVLVIGGLSLAELVYQALVQLAVVDLGGWPADGALWVETVQPWGPIVVVGVAAVVGSWRWWQHRRDRATAFLLAVAVWGGLRVPALVADLVRYPWFSWGLSMPTESMYGQHVGWVGIDTLDVAITTALLLVSIAASRDLISTGIIPVVLIGLATTIVVQSGPLVSAALSSAVGNAAAFVLPFGYLFLFDAEGLNRSRPDREVRVLNVVALSTLALTIGVLRGYLGNPVAAQDAALGAEFVAVPAFAATMLWLLATRSRRAAVSR